MDYFKCCVDIARTEREVYNMAAGGRFSFNPPAMGSGCGTAEMMTLHCAECEWVIKAPSTTAVSGAVRHGEDTGHQILYKGKPQTFHGEKA